MEAMVTAAIDLIAGMAAWTLLEYAIHAWLSHTFRTFATPLHAVHHRDPRRVFTIGAWGPVAASWLGGLALWGAAPAMLFYSGMVAGFALYEGVHFRVHFRRPRSRLERHLRERHLAHHLGAPDRNFGVTSALWDRVFGSEANSQAMGELRDAIAAAAPLTGASNLRMLLPGGDLRRFNFRS